ncbi:MAG: haloacid dehalogenase [Planctomycetes bacterium]|jgi:2-haloacid dehalogenase|nr:haloacid dehalogenase [Planctomycetota bacterium]MDP6423357.1 HAD-IA family hydrolase [Planctomycetota bacterium]
MLDWERFELISFDCYGTLVDWEAGILATLQPTLSRHGCTVSDQEALELYAQAESVVEDEGWATYRSVLTRTMEAIANELDLSLDDDERDGFVRSLPEWAPFKDTVPALESLAQRYRLAVIANVDDDLFAQTAPRLEVPFEFIVTAEQVQAYKPSSSVFTAAQARFGLAEGRWLHVAQSRYHDIAPAGALGIDTVHLDRHAGHWTNDATPATSAEPNLTLGSMRELAQLAG